MTKVLVITGCTMLLLIGVLLYNQDDGPRYKGRSLARWLDVVDRAGQEDDHETRAEATEAIRAIGTNGIPFALSQLRQEISASYLEDVRFIGSFVYKYRANREAQIRKAGWLFYIIGTNATPAVPELVAIVTNSQNQETIDRAVAALSDIGDAALPSLLSFIADSNHPACQSAVYSIAVNKKRFGTNLVLAIPHMAKHATSSPPRMAVTAIEALGFLQLEPTISIAALTNAFASTDKRTRVQALAALAQFRHEPVITIALADPDPGIRQHATNALNQLKQAKPMATP